MTSEEMSHAIDVNKEKTPNNATLANATLTGEDIIVNTGTAGPPTVSFTNVTLGAGTKLEASNAAPEQPGTIDLAGSFTIASGATVDFQVKLSAPTADNATLWSGTFIRNGVPAQAVWDMAGTPSYTAPANFTTMTDIAGNVTAIPGSHVITLQAGPLWLA